MLTTFRDPLASIFLQNLSNPELPPQNGVQTRLLSMDYKRSPEVLDVFGTFSLNYSGFCPTVTPPNNPFFPPFIEYWYDGMYMAVLSYLANGNYAKNADDLTGAELAAGFRALAPIGQSSPGSAQQMALTPDNLSVMFSRLVQGVEIDLIGTSSELDFAPELKSPTSDMDYLCIDPGDDYPSTAAWHNSGVYWDQQTDTLVPGPEFENFDCLPYEPIVPEEPVE